MGIGIRSSPRSPWVLVGWLILLVLTVLAGTHWPVFPYFLDSYYHLSVIEGFRQAGGPVAHAFWEAAPEGRPHLYPPLFHLLFLPGRSLGIHPIALARLWTWASFPVLLLAGWLTLRRVASARTASLSLILLATPYTFFIGSVNHAPATGALGLSFGVLLALRRARWLAGGIFLALGFWMHAGIPWLVASAVGVFGLICRENRATALRILALGLFLASPWLLHLARHASAFELQPRGEERFIEIPIGILLIGLAGLPLAWKRGGVFRWWVALAAGFVPMLAGYRARFFSTEGLFPWLLLSAVTLEWIWERLGRRRWVAAAGVAGLALLSPTLQLHPGGVGLLWADTSLRHLSGLFPSAHPRPTGRPLYQEQIIGELVEAVKAHTQPDELITSNLPYLSGMLTALTGRAATTRMLREMADPSSADQIGPARLVVWLKDPKDLSGPPSRKLQEIVLRHRLRPLGETGIAYLYHNPYATGRRRLSRAAVPAWAAGGMILLAAGLAGWDLNGRRFRWSRRRA